MKITTLKKSNLLRALLYFLVLAFLCSVSAPILAEAAGGDAQVIDLDNPGYTFEDGYDYTVTYTYKAIEVTGGGNEKEPTKEEETPVVEPAEDPVEDPAEDPVVDPVEEPTSPPSDGGRLERNDDGSFELIGDDGTPLGRYILADDGVTWVFEPYVPMADLPQTGAGNNFMMAILLVLGLLVLVAGIKLKKRLFFLSCLLLLLGPCTLLFSISAAAAGGAVNVTAAHVYPSPVGAQPAQNMQNITDGQQVNLLDWQQLNFNNTTYELSTIIVTRTPVTIPTPPPKVVTTGDVVNLQETSATINNNTYSGITETINIVGIEYSTTPSMSVVTTVNGIIGSSFEVNLTGLQPNTVYYYRAVVTTTSESLFGQIKSFTTLASSNPPTIKPIAENDTIISGNGISGSSIEVTFPGGGTSTTTVDSSGNWNISIPASVTLVAGQEVKATQTETGKAISYPTYSTVL